MRKIFVVLLAVMLAGCGETSGDRVLTSNFVPGSNGTWTMNTTGQPIGESEKDRLHWIADYMKMNHMCPNGYEITNRQQVISDKGLFGDFGNITYSGKCNP